MTRILALAAAGLALAAGATATAAGSPRPYYITEQQMQAVVLEHHDWGRGPVEVLDASCLGQGYHRGSFPYERYHLFLCFVTAKGWTAEYHFNVARAGGKIRYTPTLIQAWPYPAAEQPAR